MNGRLKPLLTLVLLFLVSAACELGLGLPTPVPDQVELSVLIRPPDKGYVEVDGAIINSGIAVGFPGGKLVNLVAKSSEAGWVFARWERDLSGTDAEETILMDGSKVVRAVFASVSPAVSTPEATPTPTATPEPPIPAPEGAVSFGGHWYLFVAGAGNWDEANRYAESLGGHLVTISSRAENQFVFELALAHGAGSHIIGLTDKASEGRFVWVTGEPLLYTNWDPGEPSDSTGPGYTGEDYVAIQRHTDARWNDVPKFGGGFVVEFDGLLAVPTPTPTLPDLIVSIAGPNIAQAGMSIGSLVFIKVGNGGEGVARGSQVGSSGYMVDIVLSTDQFVPPGFSVYSPEYREDVLLRNGRVSITPDLPTALACWSGTAQRCRQPPYGSPQTSLQGPTSSAPLSIPPMLSKKPTISTTRTVISLSLNQFPHYLRCQLR